METLNWFAENQWAVVVVAVAVVILALRVAWESIVALVGVLLSPMIVVRDFVRLRKMKREAEELRRMQAAEWDRR